VECDWQQYYRMDLAEAVEGGGAMSARRVAALTLGLPRESRTMRAVGGEDAAWSPEMVLAGLAVERLDALHATTVRANGGKAKRPPQIVPRPKPQRRLEAVPTSGLLDDLDRLVTAGGDD
jgi:hypothetical protein